MKPDFLKQGGLVPAVIQDFYTKEVLMLGYMNEEAFDLTRTTGRVAFFSRSKKRIWVKGEESGNCLNVKELCLDCDNDSLLISAIPVGPTCHEGTRSCFAEIDGRFFLEQLQDIITERQESKSKQSYIATLCEKGIGRVAQKVGEEATEVVIAALEGSRENVSAEAADLLFHLLILLRAKEVSLSDVCSVLEARRS